MQIRSLIVRNTNKLAKTLNIEAQLAGLTTRESLLEIARRFECARCAEGKTKCMEMIAVLDRN